MDKNNTIITISREFGSGGRAIGEKIAKVLDVPFYDKELIETATQASGLDEATFIEEENKTSKGYYFLGALGYTLGSPMSIFPGSSPSDQAFTIQSNVIRQIASEGSCVVVGRCADFVLQDFDNVISIYIHAPFEERIQRVKNEYGLMAEDVEEVVKRIDKQRANYYDYYTDRKWGNANNYNLSIDTSKFSIDGVVKIVETIIKEKNKK